MPEDLRDPVVSRQDVAAAAAEAEAAEAACAAARSALADDMALVRWALTLAGEHDSVLLAGTLKAPPRLPAAIDVDWIERGRLGAPAEEAA